MARHPAVRRACCALPTPALAQSINCSDAPYNGLIDGDVYPILPSQITIDGDCTIRDYPASNPLDVNISFYAPGGGAWLIIFDNVVHTGQMACNAVPGTRSGSRIARRAVSIRAARTCSSRSRRSTRTVPGPAATVGVPFTYTLTIPVLFDPLVGPSSTPGVAERPARHHGRGTTSMRPAST